jgi:hypothetical protein
VPAQRGESRAVTDPPGPRSTTADNGRAGRRSLAVALAALLVAFGTVRAWRAAGTGLGIDFYHYWVVAKVVGRGDVPSIYEDGSRAALGQEFLYHAMAGGSARQRGAAQFRRVLEPMSTPFLFTVLSPAGLVTYDRALDTHQALGLAALCGGLLLFGRVLAYRLLPVLLLTALAVYAFQPVHADLRVGNVSQMQLGMLAAYAWLASRGGSARQAGAGALLGAAVAFKPSLAAVPAVLVASWALDRRWQRLWPQAAGMAAGLALAVAAGAAFFGTFAAWADWAAALRAAPLATMPVSAGNFAPSAVIQQSLDLAAGWLPGAAALLGAAAALWFRSKGVRSVVCGLRRPHPTDLTLLAAGCLVFLIASKLVWQHYLVLALPAVLVLLRPGGGGRCWAALVAFTGIAIDPYADLLGITDPLRQAPIVMAAVVLLFALALIEVARAPRDP